MLMQTCPCCGFQTLSERDGYEICPICFWEDDASQEMDPDSTNGANEVSLRQAQDNFVRYGVCDEKSRNYVRKPTGDDIRDPSWKPLSRSSHHI
nr:CPCC family cysteine-rich protein [Candidatus Sigynarchaeota archaeon]